MSSRFSNQVAVVFGAGRGIGEATPPGCQEKEPNLLSLTYLKTG